MNHILIIEDDAAIRQELKLLLENALYQVTVLTEFHHVVEDILQIEPDLLLLDVNLPQQSGFEICKSIIAILHARLFPPVIRPFGAFSGFYNFRE